MDPSLLLTLCAPLAGAAYFGLSMWLGDRFPFSRYTMYSSLRRTEGAVPVVLADGREVPVDAYEHFAGIDVAAIYPRGFPCSLEWRVREIQRWVQTHAAPPGSAPGPVRIEIGFWVLRVDAKGRLERTLRVTVRGTAKAR